MAVPFQACLFDIGNVLVTFSREKMCRQVGTVLGKSPAEILHRLDRDQLQWRYECGQVSSEEFFTEVLRESAVEADMQELRRAYCDVFEEIAAMEPILASLREEGVRLVLVSNTSEAHMDWGRQRWKFFRHFDAEIFSYRIGAMKPQRRFYEAALEVAQCSRHLCFFTDDLPENVEAARQFGFRGELFTGASALRDALQLG